MIALNRMHKEGVVYSLLQRISNGDEKASNELFSLVYAELHDMAGWFIRRERPGHTLQPTALVHEVYLRMLGDLDKDWANRTHFFATAGEVMRRILVEHARSRGAVKRGRGTIRLEWQDNIALSENDLDLVLAIDEALGRLKQRDPRQANIVVLRFFAGLTEEEIALVLNMSGRTVKRDWKVAKAWLKAEFKTE